MKKKMFKNICRKSQKDLKKYVYKQLIETHGSAVQGNGYVYAQGDFPVLLVAHLDTVHKELPKQIRFDNVAFSSPNGIGGDDRCGVYMILNIVRKMNCSVLFCEDEEIGCVGAGKFIDSPLASSLVGKFNYIIEFDRKGSNDAVFYDCDNPDFEDFITKDFYKSAWGSFSDISEIAPYLECAAVNLSCGYYKAHTKDEYVVWAEMEKSIEEALKILKRTDSTDKFEYIPVKRTYINNGNYWGWSNEHYYHSGYYLFQVYYYDEKDQYRVYENYANSDYEALGLFFIEHPDLTYNHVMYVVNADDDLGIR